MTALSRALIAARESTPIFMPNVFGLSQRMLEEAAGLPRGTIAQYEQGNRVPRLEALIRIADALGLTLDELVGRKLPSGRGS